MKRLTGLDAGFLWMETPTSAMHVGGLAIYEPPAGGTGTGTRTLGVEDVREVVRARLHLAPPFRQRLVSVPFQLHFPLWIEDPDFDITNHIRGVTVPAPGGPRELADLVAELDTTQLDRDRPLWELWFIDGLEGGRVATLSKVHHAAIDGASGAEILVALFDLTPEVVEHVPDQEWVPDRVPNQVEMLGYATQSLARQPFRVLKALRRTARAALDVRSLGRTSPTGIGALPFTAPATSINGAITARRSFANARVSLSDVKAVKNAFGCTVNDVVLALSASALRRYFQERDEQLDGPLLAMVPVSVRAEDQHDAMGNQVSSMFASLATDLADPVERLMAIHEGMRSAKDQHRAIGADTLTNWTEFAAPAVFGRAMRLYARLGLADRHRPIYNVTISNVPGPPFPLWSGGAKLEANVPLGPIFDGAALNITVMSYQDSLDIGIVTCPDVVPDVWAIADGFQQALDELLGAAGSSASSTAASSDDARTNGSTTRARVAGAASAPRAGSTNGRPADAATNGSSTPVPVVEGPATPPPTAPPVVAPTSALRPAPSPSPVTASPTLQPAPSPFPAPPAASPPAAASKARPPRRSTARKAAAKRSTTKKAATSNRATKTSRATKATAGKVAAKKVTAKKPAATKSTATKATTKKAATKGSAGKRATARATAKRSTAKKSAATKVATKRAPAKKTAAKRRSTTAGASGGGRRS